MWPKTTCTELGSTRGWNPPLPCLHMYTHMLWGQWELPSSPVQKSFAKDLWGPQLSPTPWLEEYPLPKPAPGVFPQCLMGFHPQLKPLCSGRNPPACCLPREPAEAQYKMYQLLGAQVQPTPIQFP